MPLDVVQAADDSGSTEYIIRQVTDSAPGTIWAVGTELHLVNRLAQSVRPEKTVLSLDQFGCLCSTMFRVSPNHLLWILEGLLEGQVHNESSSFRLAARDEVALDRSFRSLNHSPQRRTSGQHFRRFVFVRRLEPLSTRRPWIHHGKHHTRT